MALPKSKPPSSRHSPETKPGDYLKFSGLAFELVAFILIMVWGGYKLDTLTDTEIPWFTILGVLIAVPGSIYYLLLRVK